MMGNAEQTTVDPGEIERFSRIAAEWWDPAGKFAPLHKFNPVRLGFIRNTAAAHFCRDTTNLRPFDGLARSFELGCVVLVRAVDAPGAQRRERAERAIAGIDARRPEKDHRVLDLLSAEAFERLEILGENPDGPRLIAVEKVLVFVRVWLLRHDLTVISFLFFPRS